MMFPVGEMKKSEVRRLAKEAGLPNHAKKDSTGICFIGERPFREFLNRYLPKVPGAIVDEKGSRLGSTSALASTPSGRRERASGSGGWPASGAPWYVADKRLEANELIVVQGHDHPRCSGSSRVLIAAWVSGEAPRERILSAKTRYRQADAPAGSSASCRARSGSASTRRNGR